MALLQGNTYKLPVKIEQITNDNIGTVLRGKFTFDDLVKWYGNEEGDIVVWDDVRECFIVPLTQEETFAMNRSLTWQARFKFNDGQVDGTRPKTENVYNSIDKEEL